MLIEAWNDQKDIMEWLEDIRIHPEVTRDVLAKRHKRNTNPESAITTPVIKGARIGDTKERVKSRELKTKHRVKMFILAQKVRTQYEKGIATEELMERHGMSKSQIEKISGKQEWYNIHWRNGIPKDYVKVAKELDDEGSEKTN